MISRDPWPSLRERFIQNLISSGAPLSEGGKIVQDFAEDASPISNPSATIGRKPARKYSNRVRNAKQMHQPSLRDWEAWGGGNRIETKSFAARPNTQHREPGEPWKTTNRSLSATGDFRRSRTAVHPFDGRRKVAPLGIGRSERVSAVFVVPVRQIAGEGCLFHGSLAVADRWILAARKGPGERLVSQRVVGIALDQHPNSRTRLAKPRLPVQIRPDENRSSA